MSLYAFKKYLRYPFIYLLLARNNSLRHINHLEKTQWNDFKKIKKLQWNKLKKLLHYSVKNVPYYKKLFKELNINVNRINSQEDVRKIPLLDKYDIRNNIDKILSVEYRENELIPNSTGGSTGVNLKFYNDKKNDGFRKAIAIRNDRWAGLDIGDKSAVLWGSTFGMSLQNQLKSKIYQNIFRIMFMSSYSLSDEDMLVYANKLRKYGPKVIIGYPSPLFRFANFLEDNGIRGINPKSIISSAEVLYDYQRNVLESVFQCQIFNRYGCREFGSIAHECSKHKGMHINAEHVYVECLNKHGDPATPGEKGELVITDLDNYGLPFIRYRIGDVGILSEEICPCGRGLPILEKVEGRTFDVIVGKNGKAVGGTFWTLLLRTAVKGIKQFQVVQESGSEIIIKIVPDKSFEDIQTKLIINKIRDYLGEGIKVNIQIVDKISITKSGKTRFVISKVASSRLSEAST